MDDLRDGLYRNQGAGDGPQVCHRDARPLQMEGLRLQLRGERKTSGIRACREASTRTGRGACWEWANIRLLTKKKSFGTVSSTRDPSTQWNGLSLTDLT